MLVPGGAEPALTRAQTPRHDVGQADERAAADEQDAPRIQLDGLLFAVLARALHRHGGDGALQDLQQRLLHALAGHVSGDGGVLPRFAGDLIDLVDVHDAVLCAAHVAVRGLQQPLQHGLHVVAHVTGLGQRGRVGDDERHVHHAGQRLRQVGLAHAGRPHQQDVRFGHLHIRQRVGGAPRPHRGAVLAGPQLVGGLAQLHIDALVMVVDGHGQRPLRVLLADHVPVQVRVDLHRLRQRQRVDVGVVMPLLGDDVHA